MKNNVTATPERMPPDRQVTREQERRRNEKEYNGYSVIIIKTHALTLHTCMKKKNNKAYPRYQLVKFSSVSVLSTPPMIK
jgi:hypothetical protein